MRHDGLQDDQTSCSLDDRHKTAEKPKKHFPSFWATMKHPSPNSLLPESLADPLKALTQEQKATYDYVFNTLNSPGFELPNASLNSNSTNTKSSPPQSLPVSPKLTELEKCYCSRECLLRVCRATGWDSHRALKRLVDTLIWRRDFQVDQIDYEELWEAAETGVEFTLGYDNKKRPLLYMFPAKQTSKPTWNQIRLLVWYLERAIDLMPPGVETLTLMIDFGGPGKSSNSPPTSISTAKEVLKILQTYYSERLGQAICVNVPWMFWGFFKILKPFLDPKTAQKILFDPVVTDYVPANQLLKEGFAGDLDFQYDHKTYFPLLADLTAHRRQRMLNRYKRLANGMIGISEFELRGSAHRSKNRREMSIGSETTATDTHVTYRGSRLEGGSRAAEASTQSPTGIVFHPSPPKTNYLTTDSARSRTLSVADPQRKNQLAGHNHSIVASRPFSIHSFSSPLGLPTSDDHKSKGDKKKCVPSFLLQTDSKSSHSNQKIHFDSHPRSISSTKTAPLSPSILKKSNKNLLSFHSQSLNHHNQNLHKKFDFHDLIDLTRDEHGRAQTDSMSFSRSINEVSV